MRKVFLTSIVLVSAVFARSVTIDVAEHEPIYEVQTVKNCKNDDPNIVGTVAGAVVGGIVGNQFGGGSGKKLATVAGAIGGGYAGNRIEDSVKGDNCSYENREVLTGYRNIGYYKGKRYTKITAEKQPKIVINVN